MLTLISSSSPTGLRVASLVQKQRIDVRAVMDAAMAAFPAWFPVNVYARFFLATLGSLLVLILLAVPRANSHFRKE